VGIASSVTRLGQSLVSALPPAFILLVLINIVFLGVVMWFLDSETEQRMVLVDKLLERCLSTPIPK